MVIEACRIRATPMDVANWLRGLGLEQYAPAFRDNDIDGEVLRRLTAEGEAERRQLTVMFCDLVGSTPLSARYDPEDLREIVRAYHRCVADMVARYAGFVAKYMGDGVLVYFGYPQAHEDDAERAVRAGLAVIDAVGRLATAQPLRVRLGIASGLVVVGDLIGAGAAEERGGSARRRTWPPGCRR
jgi:class 3 adenylate cyclase